MEIKLCNLMLKKLLVLFMITFRVFHFFIFLFLHVFISLCFHFFLFWFLFISLFSCFRFYRCFHRWLHLFTSLSLDCLCCYPKCYGFERASFTLRVFYLTLLSCFYHSFSGACSSTLKVKEVLTDVQNTDPVHLFFWNI